MYVLPPFKRGGLAEGFGSNTAEAGKEHTGVGVT